MCQRCAKRIDADDYVPCDVRFNELGFRVRRCSYCIKNHSDCHKVYDLGRYGGFAVLIRNSVIFGVDCRD